MLSELAVGIEDYFESIENYLIDIEKTGIGSKDAVDNIFRVFHNIKGGDSGYVGFASWRSMLTLWRICWIRYVTAL